MLIIHMLAVEDGSAWKLSEKGSQATADVRGSTVLLERVLRLLGVAIPPGKRVAAPGRPRSQRVS